METYIVLCNNNNSLHLYSAFMGTQRALRGRGNLLNHHQCAASTWMMRRQPYCARTPTTHPLTGGEETVMCSGYSTEVEYGKIRDRF